VAEAKLDLKENIIAFAREHGADLVGLAPVELWDAFNVVPVDFRPQTLFPPTQTVIVMGMGLPLPIVETTPSALHMELYRTCNRELDGLAFNLTRFLNRLGWASYFFPRDGYGSLKPLKEKPMVAFGHVEAARYAGLGTRGLNNCLLTPEFGPRVRFVSVFTSARLSGDLMQEKELCILCESCAKCCPVDALVPREETIVARYDKMACLGQAEELSRRKCYPCGICIKVCPVGRDRKLYPQKGFIKKYLQEKEALAANPEDPSYRAWTHVRKYGSLQNEPEKGVENKNNKGGVGYEDR